MQDLDPVRADRVMDAFAKARAAFQAQLDGGASSAVFTADTLSDPGDAATTTPNRTSTCWC